MSLLLVYLICLCKKTKIIKNFGSRKWEFFFTDAIFWEEILFPKVFNCLFSDSISLTFPTKWRKWASTNPLKLIASRASTLPSRLSLRTDYFTLEDSIKEAYRSFFYSDILRAHFFDLNGRKAGDSQHRIKQSKSIAKIRTHGNSLTLTAQIQDRTFLKDSSQVMS